MKRVLHISDLHFGRIYPPAIESLELFLKREDKKIDLIVMTGDWTQRARKNQFLAAAEFISRSPVPVLTIPGNHDLPLYNFFARLIQPFRGYNRFIRKVTTDTFESPELAIVGFRTATPYRTVEGRLLVADIERAEKIFNKTPNTALKIIACHHPLFQPKVLSRIKPRKLIERVIALRPHVILSGHAHLSWVELIPDGKGHSVLHISAGSATSNRLRGEVNSFHIIETEGHHLKVETYYLEENGFISKEGTVRREVDWNPSL